MSTGWKYYSKLLQKKYRQKEQKFLVEGVRLCHEALLSDWDVEVAFITPEFRDSGEWLPFQELLKQKKIPTRVLVASNFKRLCATETPQGIVLAMPMKPQNLNRINLTKAAFVLLLQGVSDPGNMGTLIRTADWFGVDGVLLSEDCVELYNPKVLRSSMGSIFHVPVIYELKLNEVIPKLKQHRFRVVASSVHQGKSLQHTHFRKPIALILGGETTGVTPAILEQADLTIRIWKYGEAESLNVAVAGGILMNRIAEEIF